MWYVWWNLMKLHLANKMAFLYDATFSVFTLWFNDTGQQCIVMVNVLVGATSLSQLFESVICNCDPLIRTWISVCHFMSNVCQSFYILINIFQQLFELGVVICHSYQKWNLFSCQRYQYMECTQISHQISVLLGFAPTQATIRNGARCGTYKAFLQRAMTRSNLHVLTFATAKKVQLFFLTEWEK